MALEAHVLADEQYLREGIWSAQITQESQEDDFRPAVSSRATSPAEEAIAHASSMASTCLSRIEGSVLEVRDCSFTVRVKERTDKGSAQCRDKLILDDINVSVQGGELLALMGPSGAGKTTLLEFMTGELANNAPPGGALKGDVLLNGRTLTLERFRKCAAFVEQYDAHWAFLTCLETLQFAAELFLPGEKARQNRRIGIAMEQLGLQECAHTRVGNAFFKGLSGGQKKRLSLGISLLKNPKLLFLDEPTSGLDAAATCSVMASLLRMARDGGLIIVSTIHQPSVEVFMSFSRVMFMANGRTAYLGSTHGVEAYCQSVGFQLPPNTNPADFFLQLVNSEFTSKEQADRVVMLWRSRAPRPDDFPTITSFSDSNISRGYSSWRQSLTALRRFALLSIRDPSVYIGRAVAFFLANSFFAFVYWDTRKHEQVNIDPRTFLLVWYVAIPSIFAVVAVIHTNHEFALVRKEVKNGLMCVTPYLASKVLLQLPYMFLLSASAWIVPNVLSNGELGIHMLLWSILVLAQMIWVYEGMAQSLAVWFKDPTHGMLAMLGIWFASFLFCGFFLDRDKIFFPLQWLHEVLPLRWAVGALIYLNLIDLTFTGSLPVNPRLNAGMPYRCPGLAYFQCFGPNGHAVLENYEERYSCIDAEGHVLRAQLIILGMGVAYQTMFFAGVLWQTIRAGRVNCKAAFCPGEHCAGRIARLSREDSSEEDHSDTEISSEDDV